MFTVHPSVMLQGVILGVVRKNLSLILDDPTRYLNISSGVYTLCCSSRGIIDLQQARVTAGK